MPAARRTFPVLLAGAAAWLSLVSCVAPSTEPRNLSLLKEEIAAYADSGRYLQEVTVVARQAGAWIERRAGIAGAASRASGGERLTVVFDLDETVLSNLPHMRAMDFGYTPEVWSKWVAQAAAAPIEPVREVYRTARRLGVEVVFLTGRRESDRAGTEKNLRLAELGDYASLIFKPDDSRETTGAFKTAARRRLVADGRTLIANVGDQESDLAGGFAERVFKLPAPFYLTK